MLSWIRKDALRCPILGFARLLVSPPPCGSVRSCVDYCRDIDLPRALRRELDSHNRHFLRELFPVQHQLLLIVFMLLRLLPSHGTSSCYCCCCVTGHHERRRRRPFRGFGQQSAPELLSLLLLSPLTPPVLLLLLLPAILFSTSLLRPHEASLLLLPAEVYSAADAAPAAPNAVVVAHSMLNLRSRDEGPTRRRRESCRQKYHQCFVASAGLQGAQHASPVTTARQKRTLTASTNQRPDAGLSGRGDRNMFFEVGTKHLSQPPAESYRQQPGYLSRRLPLSLPPSFSSSFSDLHFTTRPRPARGTQELGGDTREN